jgi:hypothetical protein
MSNEETVEEGNSNAGNQYDNPNSEVVGTDILTGTGNEVAPEPQTPEPRPEPRQPRPESQPAKKD